MAITRFANSANVRSLRSGRAVPGYVKKDLSASRIRKTPASSSLTLKRSKNSTSGSGRPPSGSHRWISPTNAQGHVSSTSTSSEGRDIRSETAEAEDNENLDSGGLQYDSNLSAPILSVPLRLTLHRSDLDVEEESPSPVLRTNGQVGVVDGREQSLLPSLAEIGLPADGVWDHDGAYGERYCYDHGETEYLLGTPDRWMSADSLGVSETVLEARLQKCGAKPLNPIPAQCWGTLNSHVQRVIRKKSHVDVTWYNIEWRRCWTPASNIDDKSWIEESLALHTDPDVRRSTRLATTVNERRIRNDRITRVMHLEL